MSISLAIYAYRIKENLNWLRSFHDANIYEHTCTLQKYEYIAWSQEITFIVIQFTRTITYIKEHV